MKKFIWILVAILLVTAAFAQETTGGMQGTVKDPSGAVVSKATVEITGGSLIGAKKVETDQSGYYRFANLPPGNYTLSVTAAGFKSMKRAGINLEVGKLPTIDLNMEVGASETVVEVTGAAPLVDVATSKVQTTVTASELVGIPKGRSFQSVIALAPGARQEPLMGNGYQINGASNAESTYLVEGQDTGDIQTGVSAADVPFEFIQEVQIKSSGFEAEYGGALGGVVNVIQKRGSNAWHGSVFTQYRGDMFDAQGTNLVSGQRYLRLTPKTSVSYCNSEDLCGAGVPLRLDRPNEYIVPKKDSYRTVNPGFEAGGYLKKDRLWLFTSFAPQFAHVGRTVNWNYPGLKVASTGQVLKAPIMYPRTFNNDTNTYFSLTRADFLVSQKIRIYGAWQNAYETNKGNSFPNADNAYLNPTSGAFANTTATQDPDNFNYGLGYKAPNVIYNTGADITLTPSLIATTRYGYFYNDFQNRGLAQGIRYRWLDPTYGYSSYSTTGVTALAPGATAYTYRLGTDLATAYQQNPGFSSMGINQNTFFDKYWRKSFNQDLAYYKKGFIGTHNLKGGYALNRLKNDVNTQYNSSDVYLGYGKFYTTGLGNANTPNCHAINTYNNANFGTAFTNDGGCGGLYGTYNLRDLQTIGQVASNNQAFYVQDAWTVGKGVTLNLGVRIDKESLPNYANALPGFKGIEFGYDQKVAPRLGGSWDVLQNGKLKLYGSFGYFFDIMKYELPRGSFGGDFWHDCIFALDNPDYTKIVPNRVPQIGKQVYCPVSGGPAAGITSPAVKPDGTLYPARVGDGFIANVDFRAPSNNPNDYRVDPNLKPMKQHEMTLGADWALNTNIGLETRYTRKRLDRTIEDAGYLDAGLNENFYIINPGEGLHAATNGLFAGNATDCAGTCGPQPKAVRNYDALEVRLTRKASARWMGVVSYTYSKLWGNYAGLTNSDTWDGGSAVAGGGGRLSPNVGRAFDEPFMQYDAHGKQTFGRLGTDRPHSLKAYGFYRLKWLGMETLIGATQSAFSGTPLSSELNASQAPAPMFVEGRGKWINIHRDPATGNLVVDGITERRTPTYTQTDLNFVHELKLSKNNEALRMGFEANVSNLFNQRTAVNASTQILIDGDILDPQYHVPATSASSQDYPSLTNFGYNWLAVANSNTCPGANCTNPGNLGGAVFNGAYGLPNLFQTGRSMRFKVRFNF